MNLTVLGATGPTGTQLVEQALAAGHHVTALARSPKKLIITNPNLHVVQGDATDHAAVSQAMKGADAVISTLGAKGSVIAAAARAIVAVAKQEGPQRIVMLSTFAVARDRLKAASKLLTGMVMGAQIKDKTAGEDALRASGLDWTIVYPTRLTNGPKTEPTVVPETTKVGVLHKISRADVASFLLQAATAASTAAAPSSSRDDQHADRPGRMERHGSAELTTAGAGGPKAQFPNRSSVGVGMQGR
jgi:uncharacterized protein YbjT (DUF2867 family)